MDHSFVIKFAARSVRAYALATNTDLPPKQQTFHRGRYEGYLQAIAEHLDIPVSQVRLLVASSQ